MLAPLLDSVRVSSVVGTWNWDLTKRTFTCNGLVAELFGVEDNVAVSEESMACYQRRIHGQDRQRVQLSLQETSKLGNVYFENYRILDLKGVKRYIRSHGTAVKNAFGSPEIVYGLMMEVNNTDINRFKAPSHIENVTERLMSAHASSRNSDDKFLTYLIEVCLRHLAETQGIARAAPWVAH